MDEIPRAIALYELDHAVELHLGNGKAIRAQITEPDSNGDCCVILTAINAGHDLQMIAGFNAQVQLRVAPSWQEPPDNVSYRETKHERARAAVPVFGGPDAQGGDGS